MTNPQAPQPAPASRMVLVPAYKECGKYTDDNPGLRADCAEKLERGEPCEKCPTRAIPAPEGGELTDDQIIRATGASSKRKAEEHVRVARLAIALDHARAALAAQPQAAEPTDFQLEQLFDAAHHFGDYGREFRERARVILNTAPSPAEAHGLLGLINRIEDAASAALTQATNAGKLSHKVGIYMPAIETGAELGRAIVALRDFAYDIASRSDVHPKAAEEDERQSFEAWVRQRYPINGYSLDREPAMDRSRPDIYVNNGTMCAWEGWRARAAIAPNVQPKGMQPCKGMNCGATDGKSHSAECFAEHAATVDPGVGERHREARYAGYKGEPFPRSASEDEQAAWMVGFKTRLPAAPSPAPAPAPKPAPMGWQMRTRFRDEEWKRWEECADHHADEPREQSIGPLQIQFRPIYAEPVPCAAVRDEVRELMSMTEAQIDDELRAMGIDPATAAQKGGKAVANALQRTGGYVCGMCGKDRPHRHTPDEVVIFRNGLKRGAAQAQQQGGA